eukprot:2888270-Pleurochrysis_carterae.AAC.1
MAIIADLKLTTFAINLAVGSLPFGTAHHTLRNVTTPHIERRFGADPAADSGARLKSGGSACTHELRWVCAQVPEETAAGYQTPGQYVQMRSGDDAKPGFFAMASVLITRSRSRMLTRVRTRFLLFWHTREETQSRLLAEREVHA